MKKSIFVTFAILFFVLFIPHSVFSQNDEDKFNPNKPNEQMKYYNKDGYEEDLQFSFEKVYRAVQKAIEETSCQIMTKNYTQTDAGLYKGKVFSDYCVFIGKTDTTYDNLQRYSVKVPIIRGGVWSSGRIQYKFILTEKQDGGTHLKLKGEISGREDYVTSKIHFWESNGIFEHNILERIKEILSKEQ